ncbi:MAG: hypothetical protein AB3N63_12480 [Puniceicoccaceae bacterium]
MPIRHTVHESGEFFIATYVGKIAANETIPAYENYYATEKDSFFLNQLVDLSKADLTEISHEELTKLASWSRNLHLERGARKRTAIYVPESNRSAHALVYEFMSEGSLEHVMVFTSKEEAVAWLME